VVELVSQAEVRAAAFWRANIAARSPLVPFPPTNVLVKPECLSQPGYPGRGAHGAVLALSPREPGAATRAARGITGGGASSGADPLGRVLAADNASYTG
jgi:hypothetical protein